jgi:hypothetical protein
MKNPEPELLRINENDLGKEFGEQASLYFEYAFAYEFAQVELLASKYELERVQSEIDKELRQNTDKRLTEAEIDRRIKLDERFKTAYYGMLDKKLRAAMLGSFVEALRQRKDMLISLGAQRRLELQHFA